MKYDGPIETHSISRKSLTALLAPQIALVCANSARLGAEHESKQSVRLLVVCDYAAAKKNIRESLLTHFPPLNDFEVVDENGDSPSIVYAEETVNDPKNSNGAMGIASHELL